MELIGKLVEQKYLIEKRLGKGGMGTVFLATHTGTQRPVAIKVIAPNFMNNQEFVERFKREAIATGRLRHPNVVNVTDFGFSQVEQQEIAYLVMEYLDGLTLADFLAQNRYVAGSLIVDIVTQVCLAIDNAHRLGIIHRDLKPQNIWLEPDGRGGYHVKVLDFGLAKLREIVQPAFPQVKPDDVTELIPLPGRTDKGINAQQSSWQLAGAPTIANRPNDTTARTEIITGGNDSVAWQTTAGNELSALATSSAADGSNAGVGLTTAGSILGTPLYMSPEQCIGKEFDARTDIYSLGVIMYQMICGETPFQGDIASLIRQHQHTAPPPIHTKRRGVPLALQRLVISSLAKDPRQRPPNCKALSVTLQSIFQGEQSFIEQADSIRRSHSLSFWQTTLAVYAPFLLLANALIFACADALWWLLPLLLFVNTLDTAASTIVITRHVQHRQTPLSTRQVLLTLLRRLPALAFTSLCVCWQVFSGLVRLGIPGVRNYIGSALCAPVVVCEDLYGMAAVRRARALAAHMSYPLAAVCLYDLLVWLTVAVVLYFNRFHLHADIPRLIASAPMFASMLLLVTLVVPLLLIVSHTRFAIAFVLIYYKARQAAGEDVAEVRNEAHEDSQRRLISKLYTKTATFSLFFFARQSVAYILLVSLASAVISLSEQSHLSYHAYFGRDAIVAQMLEAGADINAPDAYGRTPLVAAIQNGHKETVLLLLRHNADIHKKSFYGMTPLQVAHHYGYQEIALLLVQAGAKE